MIIAYHFVGATLRDGSSVPADGAWLDYPGRCVICESGLHASLHPFDALEYVPGETLCLVECDGIEDRQTDKLVCHRRRIIVRFDATELLRDMSRWAALQVIHLWDAPQVAREYLETGNEKLRAAAGAAARAAAGAAAGAAAWAAAGAAARDVAWAAARDAQKNMFLDAVENEFIALGFDPRTGERI